MIIKGQINGERIYLASLDADHLSVGYQQWMKDKDVLRYLDNPDGDYCLAHLQDFVKGSNQSAQDCLLGIFLKDGRHIGNIKIGKIHPKHKFANVGIIIGEKSMWGQGYATEAIKLCIRCAFDQLGLHKLYAGMIAGNDGSYTAFLKAGFKDVGCYHSHMIVDGKYRDARIVEIIAAGNTKS